MYRANGALFSTMETVAGEKPLRLATSFMVTASVLREERFTILFVAASSGKTDAVTMKDVANLSGFSPATVSIVLNNAPLARYIAPATKSKIEERERKLGYRTNALARFLRRKRIHIVGALLSEISDLFCTPFLCS